MKEWKIQDEVYTMIWYYENLLKDIKNKRHDVVIEFNKTKKLYETYKELEPKVLELYKTIEEIELELNITKSLLRRLKKIAEMYNIKY